MREHIIRAVLYQDMSVKWKDAELNGDVNVHLNVHQKARQIVEVELGDFHLSDGEAVLVSFEKTIDGEYNHVNPTCMEKMDGEERAYRLIIPTLVHNTPGEWGIQFFVATKYNKATGKYGDCYPSDKAYFSEHSSFIDDGLEVPSQDNMKAYYDQAAMVLETANQKLSTETTNAADIATLKESDKKINHQVVRNTADIELLKQAAIENGHLVVTEITEAYEKRKTANGENIIDGARSILKKVKGSTVVSKNLFKKSKLKGTGSFVTFNGVKCYKFADGGTTNLVYEDSFKENTQYAFRFRIYRDSGVTNGFNLVLHYADGTTKSEWLNPDTLYGIISASGKTLTKITSQINYNKTAYLDLSVMQIEEGTKLSNYAPYGLITSYFKGIKSTGRNLLKPDGYSRSVGDSSIATVTYQDGKYIVNGTAIIAEDGRAFVLISELKLPVGEYTLSGAPQGFISTALVVNVVNSDGTMNTVGNDTGNGVTFTLDKTETVRIYIALEQNVAFNNTVFSPMLVFGKIVQPWQEYQEDTIELDETLEMGEYNTFTPETGEYVKKTQTLTLNGTEDWHLFGASSIEGLTIFTHTLPVGKRAISTEMVRTDLGTLPTLGITGLVNGIYQTIATSNTFSTVDELKGYLANNPIQIAYKLAIPETKQIFTESVIISYKDGSETVLGNTNAEYGAKNTLTQEYFEIGGEETSE